MFDRDTMTDAKGRPLYRGAGVPLLILGPGGNYTRRIYGRAGGRNEARARFSNRPIALVRRTRIYRAVFHTVNVILAPAFCAAVYAGLIHFIGK